MGVGVVSMLEMGDELATVMPLRVVWMLAAGEAVEINILALLDSAATAVDVVDASPKVDVVASPTASAAVVVMTAVVLMIGDEEVDAAVVLGSWVVVGDTLAAVLAADAAEIEVFGRMAGVVAGEGWVVGGKVVGGAVVGVAVVCGEVVGIAVVVGP